MHECAFTYVHTSVEVGRQLFRKLIHPFHHVSSGNQPQGYQPLLAELSHSPRTGIILWNPHHNLSGRFDVVKGFLKLWLLLPCPSIRGGHFVLQILQGGAQGQGTEDLRASLST